MSAESYLLFCGLTFILLLINKFISGYQIKTFFKVMTRKPKLRKHKDFATWASESAILVCKNDISNWRFSSTAITLVSYKSLFQIYTDFIITLHHA